MLMPIVVLVVSFGLNSGHLTAVHWTGFAFSALTLLVGQQEIWPVKN